MLHNDNVFSQEVKNDYNSTILFYLTHKVFINLELYFSTLTVDPNNNKKIKARYKTLK